MATAGPQAPGACHPTSDNNRIGLGVPWFPVDDGLYSHPKWLATSLAARGLWVTAGSWCSDPAHHSDGAIPGHVLASLGGTPELAGELVTAGLWRRTRKGYAFHDWFDWGSKRTAKQQQELSAVRAANGRRGGLASGKARANGQPNLKQVASPGLHGELNPNTSTKEHPPNPPPSGGHDGSHPNCRACGTNRRGPPPEPASTPVPPPFAQVHNVNGNPARGDAVAAAATRARAGLRGDP
jgi:hypothetical protein